MLYLAIVFLPLVGAIIAGLFPRFTGVTAAQLISTGLLLVSACLSLFAFYDVAILGHEQTVQVARWFAVGSFEAHWVLRIDTLSAVMLVVVTFVASLVHVYSWGYMADDPHKARFFAYLSLFTFFMLMLVTADNFMQVFFGWEGVGLASYLLIGFWYKKPSANAAAIKAFVTNRIGDFGFALGIMALFVIFGSLSFDTVFAGVEANKERVFSFLGMNINAIELVAFLLFVGAMGKSAQFFLHVWLPDAMEGPTPVSALIHAATMVTAGVFLVVRCAPIFDAAPLTSGFIVLVGGMTAFFAATIGLVQNDIKRVIAYSTCSQLGYMFFAAGLGMYNVAMFHLFTHAFFKALLFLGAGSVIVGMHHEQDMRKMGGLWRKMPITWVFMLIGTLALTGFGIPGTSFGFAGFFSKDAVIEGAYIAGEAGRSFGFPAFWVGVIAALMTSFYSWRVIFMTFHGKPNGDAKTFEQAHESPANMLVPLALLAFGAIFAGVMFKSSFIGSQSADFWRGSTVIEGAAVAGYETTEHVETVVDDHAVVDSHADDHGGGHHVPLWVLWSPFVAMMLGLSFSYWLYIRNPGLAAKWAAGSRVVHPFLYNKWYFDELYDAVLVKNVKRLGDLFWRGGDQRIVDGFGPNGFAAVTQALAKQASRLQTGFVYHYAFLMLIGLVGFVTWALLRGMGAN
ncbi:MAG: NADH-quinone oxidoreductase subunit L [Robiginitomaculum sp.]|nr:NADH-quinone oxidoreductase subunit L [Robiginitomaculum sp.]